jgi:ribonuclease HI
MQARAAWREIGAEDLLLRGITAEWKDEGSEQRLQQRERVAPYRPPRALAPEFEALLEEEIREGVVKEIEEEEVKWVNPTFLVPKARTGKYRKILDCRLLNEELRTVHFKMESPETVRALLRQGDWATSLDVKSAFNHVPVHQTLRPYLAFAYKNKYYTYWGMPFGVQHAPRVFTLLMRQAIQAARDRWGARLVAYMDDVLLMFSDRSTAVTQTREIATFLQELGWTLAIEKCELQPVQEITFLGWRWNLRNATVTMPTARRRELIASLKHWITYSEQRTSRPIKELASLIGSLNFLRLQFPDAGLHMRTLDTLKVRAVVSKGWDGACAPNPSLKGDLLWWSSSIATNRPKKLLLPQISAMMTTDASPTGWGAVLESSGMQQIAFGSWKGKQAQLSSNAKELSAVRKGLKRFISQGALKQDTALLIRSDNTSTVGDINRLSAATSLLSYLQKLFTVAKNHRIYLHAMHLPGVQNQEADSLSRLGEAREYFLKEEIYRVVTAALSFEPEIDAFASTPYLPSGTAMEYPGDALRTSWSGRRLLLHPPVHLLTKTIAKAYSEEAEAILIVPQWPGQPWASILRKIEQRRRILGSYEETMTPTPRFKREGWRFPPGNAVAVLLAGRTMKEKPSSEDC